MTVTNSSDKIDSIRLIAHAIEALDQNRKLDLQLKATELLQVSVTIGSNAEYLAKAERMLDAEIIKMAETRIMDRIRADSRYKLVRNGDSSNE